MQKINPILGNPMATGKNEHAIATMMMYLLDWVVDANEHVFCYVPANSKPSLETLMKMEMARAESQRLIEQSERLGAWYEREDKRLEKDVANKPRDPKKQWCKFLETVERCTQAFYWLSSDLVLPIPVLEDTTAISVLQAQSRTYLGRKLSI